MLLVVYLVVQRWTANLRKRYADRRKRRFEAYVLGLLVDPGATEPLKRGLLIGDKGFIKELLLMQAAELKGEDSHNMTVVFEKLGYVKREMRALRSRRWWRRLEAAINLGTMQSREAVSALIGAVRDPVEDVRLAAVRALGQLNEPRGLQVLLEAIEDRDRWTGSRIAEILVGMGPSIGPEIIPRLESTTSIRARRLYVQLCGLLRLEAALGSLLLLLNDPHKETRALVAEALGQIGNPVAVESITMSLDDESSEVRAQVAKSLGMLGDKQALGKLERALSDDNWWVRHNAASSLSQLGDDGIRILHRASCPGQGAPCVAAAQVLAERTLGV